MDFVISVIASAVGSLGVETVKCGYARLKKLICSRYGEKSALAEAMRQFEQNPDSAARKAVLAEEMEKSGARQDEEVLSAAKALQQVLARQQVDARGAQIGIMGDHAHVEGGIHFGGK